jgi:uncharacterized protein (TIGR03435 family)
VLNFVLETLRLTADPGATAVAAGPSIFTAIREQLGLELEPVGAPVDVRVIDSVSQPTPN